MKKAFLFLALVYLTTTAWAQSQYTGRKTDALAKSGVADIREFGARGTIYANVPAASTATCISGSTSIQVRGINGNAFLNGDGIFFPRCGPSPTSSTPTITSVTPVHPIDFLNTNHTVPDTSGSVQYCFKIAIVEYSGAITAASREVCTTQGPKTLGAQTATISGGCTRSSNTTTCKGTGFGFTPGTRLYVAGFGGPDTSWDGFPIATTANGTTFTYMSGMDTRNGASTVIPSKTGTVRWENGIQIAFNPNPGGNAFLMAIWETSPVAQFLGFSVPLGMENSYNDPYYGTFTYYGPTIGMPFVPPTWFPSMPPSAPQSGYLATTIIAGANGASNTVLTVAIAPSNTITSSAILDNGPNIVKAANYVNARGGYLYFANEGPYNPYYIQSFTNVGSVNVVLANNVTLNGTFKTGGRIRGMQTAPCSFPQFAIGCFTGFSDLTAYPGVWTTSGYMENVYVGAQGNGYLGVLDTGYQTAEYYDDMFVGGADNDCMGLPYLRWGNSGGSFGGTWNRILFSTGPNPQINGVCSSAAAWFRNDTEENFNGIYTNRRSIAFQPADYGLQLTFNQGFESQGTIAPLIGFLRIRPGTAEIAAHIATTLPDTQSVPTIVNWAGNSSGLGVQLYMENNGVPSSGWMTLGGKPMIVYSIGSEYGQLGQNSNVTTVNEGQGCTIDGIFSSTYVCALLSAEHHNRPFILGPSNQFFTDTAKFPAPTCTVASDGSISVGTHTLTYHPIFYNGTSTGGEGEPSYPCSFTTTSGNQKVAISGVSVNGAQAYDVYIDGTMIGSCAIGYVTGFPYTYTGYPHCGASETNIPGTGLTGIQGNLIWTPNLAAYKQIQPAAGKYAGTCVFSSSTTCSITFSSAYVNTPVVVLTPVSPGSVIFTLTATSKSGFTITASTSNSLTVNWIAIGNPN